MNSPDVLSQPPKAPEIGRQLVRRAESDELFGLLEELEPFSAHPAVTIPQDPEGRLDPLVKLAHNRDINENRDFLVGPMEDPYGFLPKLLARSDGLARAMPTVTVSGVHWNKPSERYHRFHYLSLLLDPDSTLKLEKEQEELWDGMQQLGDTEGRDMESELLDWQTVMPSIMIMRLNARSGPSAPEKIASHIEKKGTFDLTLLPLGAPRDDA